MPHHSSILLMSRRSLALALLVALLLGLLALRVTPFYPVDDAYISYHYARNWADGHGPVFNPGERVEGYSNFLFVALVALAARSGITPPLAGRWLNVTAAVVVVVLLLFALPGRLRHSRVRYLAALIFALSIHTQLNVLSGLEAPLVGALVLAGALAFEHRQRLAAPLCFLALGLSRPEGIALGALAGAADLLRAVVGRDRQEPRRVLVGWTLAMAVPYAAYLFWRRTYYGHFLPNSVHAKMGVPLTEGLSSSLVYLKPAVTYYWPLVVLLVAGWLARAWRSIHSSGHEKDLPAGERPLSEPWGILLLTLGICGIALLTGSGDPYRPYLRYVYPSLPLFLVLAVFATQRLVAAVRGRLPRAAVVTAAIGLLVVQIGLASLPLSLGRQPKTPLGERLAAGFQMLTRQDTRPHDVRVPGMPLGLHAVAAWLSEHTDADELLATAEVGILPYYSGVRVLDTFGLITEHIAHLPGRPAFKSDPDYVFERKPDYFVFKKLVKCMCGGIPADASLYRDPRLRRGYDLVRMFHHDDRRVILLFKKRPAGEQPRIVYDLCSLYSDDLVVFRDKTGRPVDRPDWVRKLIGKVAVRIFDEKHRQELLHRLQPAIRGEITDFEAAELMREWLIQWSCYIRQMPMIRHDLAIVYRVAIPDHAILSFRLGLPSDPRNKKAAAEVFFEVEVEGDRGDTATVFSQGIRPADAPIWQKARVDLGAFAGRHVEISLRVYQPESDPSQRTIYNAGWLDMSMMSDLGGGPEP